MRLPVKPGQPIDSASQRTTSRSMVTAAGAERHAVTFWFRTLARRSAMAPTGSPEPSTYPKKRGPGARERATTCVSASSAAGPSPSSGTGPSNAALTAVPEVSGKDLAPGNPASVSAASSTTRPARARNSSGVSGSRSAIVSTVLSAPRAAASARGSAG